MDYTFVNINRCDVSIDYSVRTDVKSFKEEMHSHLKDIYCKNKEITLFFSGGMDSRFLARCMLDLEIPFKAYTYTFSSQETDYDSVTSSNFCKQYSIDRETIFLDKDKLFNHIQELYRQDIVFPVLNTYYMSYAITEKINNSYNGVFVTGAASEFKIKNGKIPLPYNVILLMLHYKNKLFNFTTDRIFLAYINNNLVKENYNNESLSWTDIRYKIYQQAYSDLEVIEKTWPEDKYITEIFYNEVVPHLINKAPHHFITESYQFDLEEYFLNVRSNL